MLTASKTISALFLCLALVLPALPVFAATPLRVIDGTVSRISDGDTIQVVDGQGTKVKIRFYGIDTPETTKVNKRTGVVTKPGQPYGEEAFAALRSRLEGQQVRLQVMAVDQYQRLVSIVTVDGRDINREMVANGWAWAYRQYLDAPYASDYIGAETSARRSRAGLWVQNNPQPPWEFRRSLKKTASFRQ